MKKNKYNEIDVVQNLKRLGFKVNSANKVIERKGIAIVGIKTLGKIDFLVEYCSYIYYSN